MSKERASQENDARKKVIGGLDFRTIIENDKSEKYQKVREAYAYAQEKHAGFLRKSGEPYFSHCEAVAKILYEEWGVADEKLLAAALLHDVVEDVKVPIEEIAEKFGTAVAELVEGVTKLKSSNDRETVKKVFQKTHLNPGIAVLKLADRLHNMRTLEYMPAKKRREKARETMDAYTRLADSLGMWQVKTELEDICFKYLYPKEYRAVKKAAEKDPRLQVRRNANGENTSLIDDLTNCIEDIMSASQIDGQVEIRKKGLWALKEKQQKMALKGKGRPDSFADVNDFISLRVQLSSESDCYLIMGMIHKYFGEKVDYDRLDEFFGANSRVNGYEAIQTTVNFPEGAVEIALMTESMEQFNTLGVVNLIRVDSPNITDYALKLVFTPTGSVRFLPPEATGVDFAAVIGPRVLADGVSLLVDGEEMKLTSVIPNAATVRVNLGETRRAPPDGAEGNCVMPRTREMIRDLRRQEIRDKFVDQGRKVAEKILSGRGVLVITDIEEARYKSLLYKLGCQGVDDLYFLLGNGAVKPKIFNQELRDAGITRRNLGLSSIRLRGLDGPGILGYVTQLIADRKANIVKIENGEHDGLFELRLAVKGLTAKQRRMIFERLKANNRFSEVTVV